MNENKRENEPIVWRNISYPNRHPAFEVDTLDVETIYDRTVNIARNSFARADWLRLYKMGALDLLLLAFPDAADWIMRGDRELYRTIVNCPMMVVLRNGELVTSQEILNAPLLVPIR